MPVKNSHFHNVYLRHYTSLFHSSSKAELRGAGATTNQPQGFKVVKMKTKGQTADVKRQVAMKRGDGEVKGQGQRAPPPACQLGTKSSDILLGRWNIVVGVVSTNLNYHHALRCAHSGTCSSSSSVAFHSCLRVKEAGPQTRSSPQLSPFARR